MHTISINNQAMLTKIYIGVTAISNASPPLPSSNPENRSVHGFIDNLILRRWIRSNSTSLLRIGDKGLLFSAQSLLDTLGLLGLRRSRDGEMAKEEAKLVEWMVDERRVLVLFYTFFARSAEVSEKGPFK